MQFIQVQCTVQYDRFLFGDMRGKGKPNFVQAEDGRSPAEPTAEAGVGDEAAPDEGGAEEARWVARRQAEDLLDELVHQLRRPRRHAGCSDLMYCCCLVGVGGRHGHSFD